VTLTAEEVAMFYAIYTRAERVDWACYEAFRLAVLVEGAKQAAGRPATDPPALNDLVNSADTPALDDAASPSYLTQVPLSDRVLSIDDAQLHGS